jgi:ferredoxin
MREFVRAHKGNLSGKKLIIFCTQNLFSGDGARVFTELLMGIDYQVIYAAHFNMPNNICNVFFYPLSSADRNNKYVFDADKKMSDVVRDIDNGIIRKQGFNVFSKHLGLIMQRFVFIKEERALMRDVRIHSNCNMCMLCTKICPMSNLEAIAGQVVPKGNCTLCYRCVNQCPQKAITAVIHGKVKKQYAGIGGVASQKPED